MQCRKTAIKLCSAYFFSMFVASIFINLAFINPDKAKNHHNNTNNNTESPLFADYLAEIEDLEIDYKAAQINIESKDLTGIKKLVIERRRREKTSAERELARSQRQTKTEQRAKTAAARPRVVATYAPNTYVYTEDANDPHPANGKYSKTFVPFDKDIEVYSVKYTADNQKYTEADIRGTIVEKAKKHLGTRYVWSGKKPGGFDCSGFTSYMLSLYGVHVSPSSRHQGVQGAHVKLAEAAPGDLVFFSRYGKGGRISHVAMVVENTGDKLFVIHACSRGIVIDNILNDKYWTPKILYARNVINPKGAKTQLAQKAADAEAKKANQETAAPAPVAPTAQ